MGRVFVLALLILTCTGQAQQKARKRPAATATKTAPSQWPIATLNVEGLHNYSKEQVLAVAGLKVGQSAGKDEFEAARDRLIANGAFDSVGYRFAPDATGVGYDATFQVTEAEPLYPVAFEALEVPAAELRTWLKSRDPLFGPKIAATTVVLERTARGLEELLATKNRKEKVIGKLAPGAAGTFVIAFRLAAPLPAVAEVHFTGNQAVKTQALVVAISGVAYGTPYTEDGFRQILDSSIRPLYEARGLLRVAFTGVAVEKAATVKGVVVSVTVEEGAPYNLGKVRIAPNPALGENLDGLLKAAKFKPDEPANFDDIGVSIGQITKSIRRKGYIRAEASVERSLNDRLKTVDLTISIHEGPQFVFGKLVLEGLDLHGEAAVKKLWGMKEEKPFDAGYPDYFLQRIRDDGLFDNLRNTKAVVHIDEASHVVDVTLRFN
jgi:outer membrane protein insertion porin family